jgi:hypothetical protein
MGENGKPLSPMAQKKHACNWTPKICQQETQKQDQDGPKMVMTGDG